MITYFSVIECTALVGRDTQFCFDIFKCEVDKLTGKEEYSRSLGTNGRMEAHIFPTREAAEAYVAEAREFYITEDGGVEVSYNSLSINK